MRQSLTFIAGSILALLFAAAALTAACLSWVLVKDLVLSRGEGAMFEAHLRHYTDSIELTDDGAIELRRNPHPIASMLGMWLGAWILTIALARAISRLRPANRQPSKDAWPVRAAAPSRPVVARPPHSHLQNE